MIEAGPPRVSSSERSLTHSLEHGEEGLAMKATRTCSVDGCQEAARARGWCSMHYARWRQAGDVGTAAPSRKRPEDRGCRITGCDRRHYAKGFCNPHYQRWIRHGDPLRTDNGRWTGDMASYNAVHLRLRSQRGKAENLSCAHCGEQAKDWAYDHRDPDERVDAWTGYAYSINPVRYLPLCRSCHTTFDYEAAQ